jgi:hypothetical protein
MNTTIHPSFAAAVAHLAKHPEPVATLTDCTCCDVFDALRKALEPHVVTATREYDGYFDVDVGFVARQSLEVAESRVWVRFVDCAATPNSVTGTKDGLAWEAEKQDDRWQSDGSRLVEYYLDGAF